MNRLISCLVLSVFVTGMAVGGWVLLVPKQALAAAPTQAQPIVLKLSHSTPPVSPQHKGVFVPWAEELEKRTNGREGKNLPIRTIGLQVRPMICSETYRRYLLVFRRL
jgi:hypothetical protein